MRSTMNHGPTSAMTHGRNHRDSNIGQQHSAHHPGGSGAGINMSDIGTHASTAMDSITS